MLILTAVMAWKASRWIRQIPSESMAAARSGVVAATVLFTGVLAAWSWTTP
jgi:hypothetical protein